MSSSRNYKLASAFDGLSLAAALRRLIEDRSWSQIRRLIAGRYVQVNGNLCLDEGRRVKGGDVVKVWDHPLPQPASEQDIRLVHVDRHLVVVQKPAGVTTLRHREESDLPQRRKQLQPTLDELVPRALARHLGLEMPDERSKGRSPPKDARLVVRAVHRLDRDTSGLMLFARTVEAEQKLIRMFARHEIQRAYVAVAHGRVEAKTIDTWLVRDRGDGLRGTTPLGESAERAQSAITHIRPMEHVRTAAGAEYTILECRLETGRTHQIRIHLSEIGHMLCGEKTYTHPIGGKPRPDTSRAPRHALHAAELAFVHPVTSEPLRFRMPLPKDLREWIIRLRGSSTQGV